MRHRFSYRVLLLGLALGFLAVGQPAASGSTIGPGFDLFETDPATTFVNLGTAASPIIVPLKGIPISPLLGVNLGDTDTIVQRIGATQTIGIGGMATFNLQLRALDMMSVSPVNIGGTFFDLHVIGGDLIGGPINAIAPGITITQVSANGGTFISTLSVTANLILTPVGGGTPTTSPFMDTFTANGVWSATPRSDDAHNGTFQAGGFYPGVDPITLQKHLTIEEALLAAHGVLPAQTPEPSTWIMYMMAGLMVPAYARWHRRRRA